MDDLVFLCKSVYGVKVDSFLVCTPPHCLLRWIITFMWSLQTTRITKRTCDFYVPSLFAFFFFIFIGLFCCLTKNFTTCQTQGFGKGPHIPMWNISVPGHGVSRHLVTSLLMLPGTLRLWQNYCEAIHLGSAWNLLWQIYWLLNMYPSRMSKPI